MFNGVNRPKSNGRRTVTKKSIITKAPQKWISQTTFAYRWWIFNTSGKDNLASLDLFVMTGKLVATRLIDWRFWRHSFLHFVIFQAWKGREHQMECLNYYLETVFNSNCINLCNMDELLVKHEWKRLYEYSTVNRFIRLRFTVFKLPINKLVYSLGKYLKRNSSTDYSLIFVITRCLMAFSRSWNGSQ